MKPLDLDHLFKSDHKPLLSIFMTAGYPNLNDTEEIVLTLEECGVDFLELGIPFSDPVADGPVIQASSEVALKNGMNLELLFDQLAKIRKRSSLPILLMGYINPVLSFGVESFLEHASRCGIYGTILPDLPLTEFEREYRHLYRKYGVKNIFLVTPQTTADRLKKIDSVSEGFIYMVSTSATTGGSLSENSDVVEYFKRVAEMKLNSPRMIGFGIKDRGSFEFASRFADGAIIGSAFVSAITEGANKNGLRGSIKDFISQIRG